MSWVYYAHLHELLGDPRNPIAVAGHYTGSVRREEGDWRDREREHRASRGSAILRAANERGIAWWFAEIWELRSDLDAIMLEGYFKARSHAPDHCVACQTLRAGQQPLRLPIIHPPMLVHEIVQTKKPIEEIVERRQRRVNRRAQERTLHREWLQAVHADADVTVYGGEMRPCMDENGKIYTLATVCGDRSTSWPLEFVDATFDIEAWRERLD